MNKFLPMVYYRGISDTNTEEIFVSLFGFKSPADSLSNPRLPSVVKIPLVKADIKHFFEDKERFTCVGFAKSIPTEDSKNVVDSDFGMDMNLSAPITRYSEEANLYLSKINGEYVLSRLSMDDESKDIFFTACSYNQRGLNEFFKEIKDKFAVVRDLNKEIYFGILYQNGSSIQIRKYPLDDKYAQNLNIKLNYGEAFEGHHKNIVERLTSNKHGIFIFHGSPGTGKTTYIKHLAKLFGGKRTFIFIPTTFIDSLVSPSLIPVLIDNKDSVLVLEDAEKAVVSRAGQSGNESLVSSLLNIGDGILGSMLNLSLIVTFNTSKESVDAALMRKGRLQYEHKFDPLNISDAQKLLKSLNKTHTVDNPMTLAEIYNLEHSTNHVEEEQTKIGFKP
jgi:hypothetical protein